MEKGPDPGRFRPLTQALPTHKVARKRDPPGVHSTGRDALLRVRSGNGGWTTA